MSSKIIDRKQAAQLIKDNDTVAVCGFVGFGIPEEILVGIQERFKETQTPRDLSIFHTAGIGDAGERGANRLGHEGLVKQLYCAHIGLEPAMNKLTVENKIATYMVPQGVNCQLLRAIAGKKVGVITHVGLKTFADPRLEGCKVNDKAREAGDVVELLNLAGREQLFYRAFPINVAIIKGTYGDEDGNITLQHEAAHADQLEMASAAHNCGGIVIAQVDRIVARNTLKPQDVKVHGFMVDYIVEGTPEYSYQSYTSPTHNPAWSGEIRVPLTASKATKLSDRKIIGRRGSMELRPNMLVNLGIGIPDQVAVVAQEEGIADQLTLSIESGILGGVPLPGLDIGGSVNAGAMYKHADIFDIYDGGGIDLSCLGAAQIDAQGNVNVSKFGGRVVGPGGFINISQNAKKVCFCGTFVAGKMELEIKDGKLNIIKDGTGKKFVNKVEQVTFSGEYSRESGQEALYITERAVFRITDKGLTLTEIAPGVDLEKHILAHMEFTPHIAEDLKLMDLRIFQDAPMGLTL